MKKISVLLGLLLASSIAHASLHLIIFIEAKNKATEVAFLETKKTPAECGESAKNLETSAGRNLILGNLKAEDRVNVIRVWGRCAESNIIFSALHDSANYVYLLRFVAGRPSVTAMSSIKSCQNKQKVYSSVAGRESYCVVSAQDIIYQ